MDGAASAANMRKLPLLHHFHLLGVRARKQLPDVGVVHARVKNRATNKTSVSPPSLSASVCTIR